VTISFGLVSIPAEIYPAANPAGRVSFNLLHSCGSRVKQEYRCVEEDKIVPREELVKGYEFEQERFVTFSKEELKALNATASELITIDQFLSAAKSELRSQKALGIAEVEVKQQELDLATRLIDSISVDEWEPEQFTDEVQARIREQIQRKVEGKEIVAPEAPVGQGGARVIDLMQALRASLKRGHSGNREDDATTRTQTGAAATPRRAAAKRATRRAA